MRMWSCLMCGILLSAAPSCTGVSDTDRGGGVSRTLPDPAWVILLDHHQDQYPNQWAYVFASGSAAECRKQVSYSESELNLASRRQYEGQEVEAKSLSDVRRGRERTGRIVRLLRVGE